MYFKKSLVFVAASALLASAKTDSGFKLLRRDNPVPTYANPAGAAGNVAGVIKKLLDIFDNTKDSWDYEGLPQMCELHWQSKYTGECFLDVTCHDGETTRYDFQHCDTKGPNMWDVPQIGKVHIQFMDKDDDTPSKPILWADYVNEGEQMDVEAIYAKNDKICYKKDDIYWDGEDHKNDYWCGLPKIGKSGGDLDSEGPVNDQGYAPGWCGVHVTQYQKPDPSKDNYKFDVAIKDNNEDVIGEKKGIELATDESSPVSSSLEWQVVVKAGAVDDDAVWMYYGADAWSSNDQEHHCDFGAYDSGKREGDCGFSC